MAVTYGARRLVARLPGQRDDGEGHLRSLMMVGCGWHRTAA